MGQDIGKRWPHEVVEIDMGGSSPSSKCFKKSSISLINRCTNMIFDCYLCRWIIGFLFWSKGILMKIPCCRRLFSRCCRLFRGAKQRVWKLSRNEECKSWWDKAAVFCVPIAFMMCGTVFVVLTCKGPCAVIYNRFQNVQKNTLYEDHDSLWDKAAVFCVPFVFMMCGTVFFVLTCEGPCAIISKRFQYFQKNTLYEDHDRLVRENENLKTEIGRLHSIYQEETERLKYDNEHLENRVNEEKTEKEKALTRLSTIAGERLRLHNPGIADLSDENRPNKLAEKFSELYDYEWIEALESLNRTGQSETVSVENLLKTLKEIYTTCMRSAQNQRESLIQIITKPSTKVPLEVSSASENIMSKVVDLQKQTSSSAFIDTKNLIIDENPKFAENNALLKYTERSIELCWLMAIQDPPMMLNFGPAQNEDMDTNTFRAFTRMGQKADFVVWPAVYLYKGGPLVHKGVLEPIVL